MLTVPLQVVPDATAASSSATSGTVTHLHLPDAAASCRPVRRPAEVLLSPLALALDHQREREDLGIAGALVWTLLICPEDGSAGVGSTRRARTWGPAPKELASVCHSRSGCSLSVNSGVDVDAAGPRASGGRRAAARAARGSRGRREGPPLGPAGLGDSQACRPPSPSALEPLSAPRASSTRHPRAGRDAGVVRAGNTRRGPRRTDRTPRRGRAGDCRRSASAATTLRGEVRDRVSCSPPSATTPSPA